MPANELPDELQSALKFLLGMEWPEGDVDGLNRISSAWSEFSGAVEAMEVALARSGRGVQDNMGGEFAESYRGFVEAMRQSITEIRKNADGLADVSRNTAADIQYAKIMIIGQLVIMLAMMALEWIPFIGPALAAAAQVIARVVISQILAKVIANILLGAAMGLVLELGLDVAIQGVQMLTGQRTDWNEDFTTGAAISGVVSGAIGGAAGSLLHIGVGKLGRGAGKDAADALDEVAPSSPKTESGGPGLSEKGGAFGKQDGPVDEVAPPVKEDGPGAGKSDESGPSSRDEDWQSKSWSERDAKQKWLSAGNFVAQGPIEGASEVAGEAVSAAASGQRVQEGGLPAFTSGTFQSYLENGMGKGGRSLASRYGGANFSDINGDISLDGMGRFEEFGTGEGGSSDGGKSGTIPVPTESSGGEQDGSTGTGKPNTTSDVPGTGDSDTSGEQESGSESSGKQGSVSDSSGRQESGSESSGKQGLISDSSGRQDSVSDTSGRQDSGSESSGKQESVSNSSGKQDSFGDWGSESSGRQDSAPPSYEEATGGREQSSGGESFGGREQFTGGSQGDVRPPSYENAVGGDQFSSDDQIDQGQRHDQGQQDFAPSRGSAQQQPDTALSNAMPQTGYSFGDGGHAPEPTSPVGAPDVSTDSGGPGFGFQRAGSDAELGAPGSSDYARGSAATPDSASEVGAGSSDGPRPDQSGSDGAGRGLSPRSEAHGSGAAPDVGGSPHSQEFAPGQGGAALGSAERPFAGPAVSGGTPGGQSSSAAVNGPAQPAVGAQQSTGQPAPNQQRPLVDDRSNTSTIPVTSSGDSGTAQQSRSVELSSPRPAASAAAADSGSAWTGQNGTSAAAPESVPDGSFDGGSATADRSSVRPSTETGFDGTSPAARDADPEGSGAPGRAATRVLPESGERAGHDDAADGPEGAVTPSASALSQGSTAAPQHGMAGSRGGPVPSTPSAVAANHGSAAAGPSPVQTESGPTPRSDRSVPDRSIAAQRGTTGQGVHPRTTSGQGEAETDSTPRRQPDSGVRDRVRADAEDAVRALGKVPEGVVDALRLRARGIVGVEHQLPGFGVDRSLFVDVEWLVARELHAHGWAPGGSELVRGVAEGRARELAVGVAHELGTRRTSVPSHGFGSGPGGARGGSGGSEAGPSGINRIPRSSSGVSSGEGGRALPLGDAGGGPAMSFDDELVLKYAPRRAQLMPDDANRFRARMNGFLEQLGRLPGGAAPLSMEIKITMKRTGGPLLEERRDDLEGVVEEGIESREQAEQGWSWTSDGGRDLAPVTFEVAAPSGARGSIWLDSKTVMSSDAKSIARVRVGTADPGAASLTEARFAGVLGLRFGAGSSRLPATEGARLNERVAGFLAQVKVHGQRPDPLAMQITLDSAARTLFGPRRTALLREIAGLAERGGWSWVSDARDESGTTPVTLTLTSPFGARGLVTVGAQVAPKIARETFTARVLAPDSKPVRTDPAPVGLSFEQGGVELPSDEVTVFRAELAEFFAQIEQGLVAPDSSLEITLASRTRDPRSVAARLEHLTGVVNAMVYSQGWSAAADRDGPGTLMTVTTPFGASGTIRMSTAPRALVAGRQFTARIRVPKPVGLAEELGFQYGSDTPGDGASQTLPPADVDRFRAVGKYYLNELQERGRPLGMDINLNRINGAELLAERRADLQRIVEELVDEPRELSGWSVERADEPGAGVTAFKLVSRSGAEGRISLSTMHRVKSQQRNVDLRVRFVEPKQSTAFDGDRFTAELGARFVHSRHWLRDEEARSFRARVDGFLEQVQEYRPGAAPLAMTVTLGTNVPNKEMHARRRDEVRREVMDRVAAGAGPGWSQEISRDQNDAASMAISLVAPSGARGHIAFVEKYDALVGKTRVHVKMAGPSGLPGSVAEPLKRDDPGSEEPDFGAGSQVRAPDTNAGVLDPPARAFPDWEVADGAVAGGELPDRGIGLYAPTIGLNFDSRSISMQEHSRARFREQVLAFFNQVQRNQADPAVPLRVMVAQHKAKGRGLPSERRADLRRVLVNAAEQRNWSVTMDRNDWAGVDKIMLTTPSGATGGIRLEESGLVLLDGNRYSLSVSVPNPNVRGNDPGPVESNETGEMGTSIIDQLDDISWMFEDDLDVFDMFAAGDDSGAGLSGFGTLEGGSAGAAGPSIAQDSDLAMPLAGELPDPGAVDLSMVDVEGLDDLMPPDWTAGLITDVDAFTGSPEAADDNFPGWGDGRPGGSWALGTESSGTGFSMSQSTDRATPEGLPAGLPKAASYVAAVSGHIVTGRLDDALGLLAQLNRDPRVVWAVLDFYAISNGALDGGTFVPADLVADLQSLAPHRADEIGRALGLRTFDFVPEENLRGLFEAIKSAEYEHSQGRFPVRYDYPDDNCFYRAHLGCLTLRQHGVTPAKIFIANSDPGLMVKSSSAEGAVPGFPVDLKWTYHVAPVVTVARGQDQVRYVFDPAVEPERPLLVAEWMANLNVDPARVDFQQGAPEEIHAAMREDYEKNPEGWTEDGYFPREKILSFFTDARVLRFPGPTYPAGVFATFRDTDRYVQEHGDSEIMDNNAVAESREWTRQEFVDQAVALIDEALSHHAGVETAEFSGGERTWAPGLMDFLSSAPISTEPARHPAAEDTALEGATGEVDLEAVNWAGAELGGTTPVPPAVSPHDQFTIDTGHALVSPGNDPYRQPTPSAPFDEMDWSAFDDMRLDFSSPRFATPLFLTESPARIDEDADVAAIDPVASTGDASASATPGSARDASAPVAGSTGDAPASAAAGFTTGDASASATPGSARDVPASAAAGSTAQASGPVVKRGRGRPRKYPIPETKKIQNTGSHDSGEQHGRAIENRSKLAREFVAENPGAQVEDFVERLQRDGYDLSEVSTSALRASLVKAKGPKRPSVDVPPAGARSAGGADGSADTPARSTPGNPVARGSRADQLSADERRMLARVEDAARSWRPFFNFTLDPDDTFKRHLESLSVPPHLLARKPGTRAEDALPYSVRLLLGMWAGDMLEAGAELGRVAKLSGMVQARSLEEFAEEARKWKNEAGSAGASSTGSSARVSAPQKDDE